MGTFTSCGVEFLWKVQEDYADGQQGLGSSLTVTVGDFSVSRRYPDPLAESDAQEEAKKIVPAVVALMERWLD